MQTDYRTPGVYVEEISTLPPSVVELATAVPAFIGYTEKQPPSSVARVSTLLDYEELFGGPDLSQYVVHVDADDQVTSIGHEPSKRFSTYYQLSHYFKNGGGPSYVVSIGDYKPAAPAKGAFEDGLSKLAREDEPTLVVLVDAVKLKSADYYDVCQQALAQCHTLGDRFAILDVPMKNDPIADFRTNIGSSHLEYGAAYYPDLQTTLVYRYEDAQVTVKLADGGEAPLVDFLAKNNALYNRIKAALAKERVVLPPSASMAGVYASVDRDRGVWKAPANVSLNAVIGPVTRITSEDQASLNVDTSGKSINAIRAFTGKGTLVWGARTLDGNSNEWRYVSVRRLFNTIEESTRKATDFAVFEPNDMNTWLKVQGMIESYLYGLWERGALAGATTEAAYFVKVGLGTTMTPQDVLEGRMIVEIGIAAVRPAEFIVLRFTHKLQEA